MKKILTGILGIILVVSVVSASAYALFSSTITVSGITMSTGNAKLLAGQNDDVQYGGSFQAPFTLPGLYPGLEISEEFQLKNASASDIDLKISARLTNASGDWSTLKDVMYMKITHNGSNASTGWKTLAEWNQAGGVNFPGGNLSKAEGIRDYTMSIRVSADATNAIANKAISNVTFVTTGTQVNP